MSRPGMQRKLAAIFSADVAGYSRLMGEDEAATIRTLRAYQGVMTALIHQYRGRVVDTPGDNLLAEFASAVDAVQSAVAIQQELTTRNTELPAARRMAFRIGINLGDVVVEGEKLYGDGVNIAARLEGLAEPGGICISGTVYDQVESKVPLTYEYLGEQAVKNIARPIRVYKIGLAVRPFPPLPAVEQTLGLPVPDKPSIAVLPFTNMSADPEQDYFSDGITEDLITSLSKVAGLFIIARHSVFTYKGKAVTVQEVGRELGVHYILEGSVRKSTTQVRITAQLIDTTTGGHLWAEHYDRALGDIFVLQDEITQKIVFALKVTLSPEEQSRFGYAPTTNLEAYDYYLRAETYFWRVTQASIAQARHLFERALELDPQYAAAMAFLGDNLLHRLDHEMASHATELLGAGIGASAKGGHLRRFHARDPLSVEWRGVADEAT